MKALLLLFLVYFSLPCFSSVVLEDPSQSIRYWRPHQVQSTDNLNVAIAQGVFEKLARIWNSSSSRIPPALAIVRSDDGPWAASLEDGNILLSEKALEISLMSGNKNQLAFILAHELAHQKDNDVWDIKYLRLTGVKLRDESNMPTDLSLEISKYNNEKIIGLDSREIRADEQAVVLMSMVGFDPFDVIRGKSFFVSWAEKSWRMQCGQTGKISSVCQQAKMRTSVTIKKLEDIARKATIFDLATQAYVAGDYQKARNLYVEYEKSFPGHIVHDNIGLTYIMESLNYMSRLRKIDRDNASHYLFPVYLNTQTAFNSDNAGGLTRGVDKSEVELSDLTEFNLMVERMLNQAASYFITAITINPDYKPAYQHLTILFILQNKMMSAKAQLEDNYKIKFGEDDMYLFLSGLVFAVENKKERAVGVFKKLLSRRTLRGANVLYAASYNLAYIYRFQKNFVLEKNVWRNLIKRSQEVNDSTLFRLALRQLKPNQKLRRANGRLKSMVDNLTIGDTFQETKNSLSSYELWMSGELFNVFEMQDGKHVVTDSRLIVQHVWQETAEKRAEIIGVFQGDSSDRPLKLLGVPQRQTATQQGLYLSYDDYGLAFNIVDDKVSGWFVY